MSYIKRALGRLRFSRLGERIGMADQLKRSVDRDVDELVALATRLELPEWSLDEAVYDSEAPSASWLNNQGIEAQLRWLLSVNDTSTVRKLIQDAGVRGAAQSDDTVTMRRGRSLATSSARVWRYFCRNLGPALGRARADRRPWIEPTLAEVTPESEPAAIARRSNNTEMTTTGDSAAGPSASEQRFDNRDTALTAKTPQQLRYALESRVRYSTVCLSSVIALRYVAIARSGFSDDLHIVGGAVTLPHALATFARAVDFDPEAVVDLGAGDEARCVLLLTGERPGTHADERYSVGIADLRP